MPEKPYVCPHCGSMGYVRCITHLIENIRYDDISCECGAVWRVYYKFENPKIEVMFTPPQEEKANDNSEPEQVAIDFDAGE